MEDMEVLWQNCETLRDKYCKKQYDANRGGAKLSKGHLYCPVFKGHFHDLYFMDLPFSKLFMNIELPEPQQIVPVVSSASGSNTHAAAGHGEAAAAAQDVPAAAAGILSTPSSKRARHE
jgi:hypothetical protein